MKRNIYTSLRISHTLEAACFTVFDRDRDVINYFYFVPIKHTRLGELEVVEYSRVRNYVFNDEQLCAHMQWADPEIVEVDLTPYLL